MAVSTRVSAAALTREKGIIAGMKRFIGRLMGWKESMRRVTYIVGYKAEYAVWVHENTVMKLKGLPRPSGIGNYWDPIPAQGKFLEKPARELAQELADDIANAVAIGLSKVKSKSGQNTLIREAVLAAALKLLLRSQIYVPVEYGPLKASGYVELEEEKDE